MSALFRIVGSRSSRSRTTCLLRRQLVGGGQTGAKPLRNGSSLMLREPPVHVSDCRLAPGTATMLTRCRSSASRAMRRSERKNHEQYEQQPVQQQATTNKSRRKKKAKKKKQKPPAFQYMTHGPNGRLLMTKERLTEPAIAVLDLTLHTAKNLVNNAKTRLKFQLHNSHIAEGPPHEQLFHSTNTVVIPQDASKLLIRQIPPFATVLDDGSIQLICTGAARSKKQAEFFAAIDTITHLQECGIDARNPPDLAAIRREQEKERFKAQVQNAQMLLEMFGVSRPQFTTLGVGSGFVSSMSVRYRGRRITAEGSPGKSKAEANGNATIAAAEKFLQDIVDKDRADLYQKLIEASPANHVAALHVPRLEEDAYRKLDEVMGDKEDFAERMEEFAMAKAEFVQRFNARRRQRRRAPSHWKEIHARIGADRLNYMFISEEQARVSLALENPEGKQGKLKEIRDALPITAIREELLGALQSEQVAVVSGGTGSGKSTQCPQYILEDAIAQGKGADTRIVVTQPRRIAAISVAERIADERDEQIGNSVGYTVRFKKQPPRDVGASIEFVTTGVLLRRLVNDPELEGVSHVVIDEVHERDIDTDFLLVLLRDLLPKKPDLRVVLMSATLDAESFASYFSHQGIAGRGRVPMMSVPPKPRHPVEVIHLEDLAGESTDTFENNSFPSDLKRLASSLLEFHDQQLQLDLEEADAEEAAATKLEARSLAEDEGKLWTESDSESDDEGEDYTDTTELRAYVPMSSSRAETLRRAVSNRMEASGNAIPTTLPANERIDNREVSEITIALITQIAQHLARVETEAGRKGSVLCFLPGWDEINQALGILEDSDPFLRKSMTLLPLHSTIPQDDQQKVFEPAADGTVKVILATNIAESSVTIDDVLAVVDSGLVRELSFDPESVMSTMETLSISRASATQRLGRAGRVAPGKCYRLYSRGALEAMYERPTPEIQRTALEATCLQTCSMTAEGVATFLQRAMDPPSEESVSCAMDRLVSLGAIDFDPTGGEVLSPLGHCLSRLPLDPATGRMLILGCVMQCLDPVLTAAACFSSREVFYTPLGMRDEQREVRRSFCDSSDLMANIRAYNEFHRLVQDEGWSVAKQWAFDNFVSIAAMNNIRSVRSQLLNELNQIGLVHKTDLMDRRQKTAMLRSDAVVNKNTGLEALHVALWATGLPDSLAARRQLGSFGTLRTRMEHHAGLHPSSVAFHRKPPSDRTMKLPPWFFYREMILSSQVFLRGCTAIHPEQIILFGGYSLKDATSAEDSRAELIKPVKVLDDWIVVEGPCDDTIDLLSDAREDIQAALDLKVMKPRQPLPPASQAILDAVCDVYKILYEQDNTQGEAETNDEEDVDTSIGNFLRRFRRIA